MNSHAYQLIALGARYLFVFLAFLIVFRAGLSLLSEHRRRKKILRNLPDAGMVGEVRDIDSDRAYPLPREGVLGSGRGCDIRLRGIRRRHVNFSFVEGKGLLLTPCHSRSEVQLNHAPIGKGGYALHGAVMRVGGYTLRIRLFAGLNVPRAASFAEHWQPAYGEDLYAPDPYGLTQVTETPLYDPAPYEPAPYEPVPYEPVQEEAPVYEMYEPAPIPSYQPAQSVYQPQPWSQEVQYTQPLAAEEEDDDTPLPFDTGMYAPRDPQEDDIILTRAPRVRHHRSERNRNA